MVTLLICYYITVLICYLYVKISAIIVIDKEIKIEKERKEKNIIK